MQTNATAARGIDITLLNVEAPSFRPPPVGQVEQLLREERTVARQVGSGGDVAQEVSTVAPVQPLQREGDNVIVVVTYCCVSPKVVEVVVAEPAVESGDTSLVVQSSVDDACEEPLCAR